MSSAFTTRELRWFFNSDCPPAVKDWYCEITHFPRDVQAPEREDIYLLPDGRDDIGLKLRKNKLQLKTRDHQEVFISGQIKGLSEGWRRHSWTIAGETPEALGQLFFASPAEGRRHALIKRRLQATFALAAEMNFQQEAATRSKEGYVTIELTEIWQDAVSYWSLCLETVPSRDHASAFDRAIARLLETYPGPSLSQDNSYGYPEFLRKTSSPFFNSIA